MRLSRFPLVAVLLILPACTYHGSLRSDFYSSTASPSQEKKFPLRAILSVEAKNLQYEGAFGVGGDIDLHPGLDIAVRTEMGKVFEDIVTASSADSFREDDVLARVSLAHRVAVDKWNGGASVHWKLKSDFRRAANKLPISMVELNGQLDVKPSGQSVMASFVTGLCLFVCTPLTIPWMANAAGTQAMEVLEEVLHEQLPRLAETVRDDPKLLAFVQGPPSNTVAVGTATRSDSRRAVTSDVDSPPSQGQVAVRKNAHAVIIGIQQHRNSMPDADFAERDAQTVARYLRKTLGFAEENVALLTNGNATKSDLEKYLEGWLPDRVEAKDTVFIYFSGHGMPNTKTGKAYLVPFDGDPVFPDQTAYPLDRLYNALEKLPAKEIVVVLDSCFSGVGGRSVIAAGMRPMILTAETPLSAGKTVVLSASTGAQVSATYKDQGHGLLTYFFLKGLQGAGDMNHDGLITLQELYSYLRPEVERTARRDFHNEQTPQLLGSPAVLDRQVVLLGASLP